MAPRRRFRTTRDIVIPAGTELATPPRHSTRWGRDFEAPIALDRDHTGYVSMDVLEGLAAGILEETDLG